MFKNRCKDESRIHRRDWFVGATTVFDLSGTISRHYRSHSAEEDDFSALKQDWEIIGKEIWEVIKKNPANSMAENV